MSISMRALLASRSEKRTVGGKWPNRRQKSASNQPSSPVWVPLQSQTGSAHGLTGFHAAAARGDAGDPASAPLLSCEPPPLRTRSAEPRGFPPPLSYGRETRERDAGFGRFCS
jgi:hypothetical protein